jgi:hypothetical protein
MEDDLPQKTNAKMKSRKTSLNTGRWFMGNISTTSGLLVIFRKKLSFFSRLIASA